MFKNIKAKVVPVQREASESKSEWVEEATTVTCSVRRRTVLSTDKKSGTASVAYHLGFVTAAEDGRWDTNQLVREDGARLEPQYVLNNADTRTIALADKVMRSGAVLAIPIAGFSVQKEARVVPASGRWPAYKAVNLTLACSGPMKFLGTRGAARQDAFLAAAIVADEEPAGAEAEVTEVLGD